MNTIPKIHAAHKHFFRSQITKDVSYRINFLKKLKAEIESKEQAIYDALYEDFKKPEFESHLSEFALVISELDLAIKNTKKWSKPERVRSSILTFPSSDYIYKDPYGIVLIIAPWNYPFVLAMAPLIMAIAAGNTVVLKPSELTQNTSLLLTEIIENVFPKDLAISVEGGVDVSTELLAQHWDYIFFTGSVKVGKIVAAAAAKHLTPVTLELGGKSPCIIDDSIDLKLVAKRLVWGKFLNAGQTCIAPDYVLIKSNIKEKFIGLLKSEIISFYGNDPKTSPDFARIINASNFERLNKMLQDVNVVFGGAIDSENLYIAPTLIDEPTLESKVMQEEIFGPILPILSYGTIEDLKAVIWNYDKPLALYTFSKDTAFKAKILRTFCFGGGAVNDTLIHFGNQKLPFGGVGSSGIGQYHGKFGFDTFTHNKALVKRGTWFDPNFRYAPYKNKLKLLKTVFKYFS
ncbi:aldehyde dehydrogenase [Changchengzhania lutea]|uniref:aldehyde dehydrogenase n=1 Tax=Changchengzhania lutea TaxID=2049305 RepID=UPI00115D2138|nr:aldehyde dehydrogenase [Changchengzhania lutea]